MPAGRPPKPTAVKKLGGNPGHRPLNEQEPQFQGRPTCPTWITGAAKTEWKRIVAHLEALDMLRAVDSAALASYCQSYARWMQAEKTIEREGQTHKEPILDRQGEVVGEKIKRHPATLIAKDCQAAMHRAASLFGFDPSSRTRVKVGDGKPAGEDEFTKFQKSLNEDTGEEETADVEQSSRTVH